MKVGGEGDDDPGPVQHQPGDGQGPPPLTAGTWRTEGSGQVRSGQVRSGQVILVLVRLFSPPSMSIMLTSIERTIQPAIRVRLPRDNSV